MKKISNNIKPALALCSFLLLAFATFAQAPIQRKVDGIIVKIDKHIILRSELEFAFMQYISQAKVEPSQDLKCQILESMVQDKFLVARAEIDSVIVDDSEVNSNLNRRIEQQAAQVGGIERIEQYFGKSIKQIKDDLRRSTREMLVVEKMQREITQKVTVTPREIRNYFDEIPRDSLPYFSSEVELGQIVKNAQVSRQQKAAARQRLEEIRARIVAGEDFATLAKQYSEDLGSAEDGGQIGFMKKNDLVPEYSTAALKLEPGQISNVVESQFGFHLIQLIERRAQEFNSRHILIKPTTSAVDVAEAIAELDSIRTLIVNDSMSFAKAAKEFSDDKATKDSGGMMTNRATYNTYFPMDQVDPSIFFVIDTMKVGEVSKVVPFRTFDGQEAVRIIYLKSKTAPHLANLSDDYQKIAAAALEAKKAKAVEAWFKKNINTVYIDIDPEFQQCKILDLIN